MTKAKLTRIPKRVLACVLAVLMVLSCLTMLPFTGFAATPTHATLEKPSVVKIGSYYYAFGDNNTVWSSSNMANWENEGTYLTDTNIQTIANLYSSRLGQTITKDDISSPEVAEINGKWYLYLSVMKGSTSMIVVGSSDSGEPGSYSDFTNVLETGFSRSNATNVLQNSYFIPAYSSANKNEPDTVKDWGTGSCYYFSNWLGILNFKWFTEQLPRAYAPSIAYDETTNTYWMAYGYRDGGIWMQKINPANGTIDFTWSGNNWDAAGGRNGKYHYRVEESYDQSTVGEQRFDPYFGELLVHTTQGGDTDTNLSSVSRAGEEPELYFVNGQAYLQVSYGGSDNTDGYNVRSYKNNNDFANVLSADSSVTGTVDSAWNFVDMNGLSGVANANKSMLSGIANVTSTGLKLMGDYSMPGTASETYYTSPGASSVTTDGDLTFYSYQVKLNNAITRDPSGGTEMRTHLLLQNANGEPLVTPFEYTGLDDAKAYEDSATEPLSATDVAGQYYVTMTGTSTSTSKQNYGGITLTAGGLVSGLISGTWAFETAGNGYVNGIVIDAADGTKYHGAFLKQTVEDDTTLRDLKTTTTFTLVGGNETVWGAWYANYTPAGENNANAHLSVSPAIYTGGALALNANTNGQLGLKYGNYISVFGFADIDYSTYITIDKQYKINDQDGVLDDNDNAENGGDGTSGIEYFEVTQDLLDLDDNAFAQTPLAQSAYGRRSVDNSEVGKGNGSDQGSTGEYTGTRDISFSNLKATLQAKLDSTPDDQRLYVLSGFLESNFYGRNATMNTDNPDDKGDIVLRVYYTDTTTNLAYNERIYSHVYQQPVSANVSGAVYDSWGSFGNNTHVQNAVFLRAEGSYADDSRYANGRIRNSTIQEAIDQGQDKTFAARGTYLWYNPTLSKSYNGTPSVFPGNDPNGVEYYHGEMTPILRDVGGWTADNSLRFNEDGYRNAGADADIHSSYESTYNDNSNQDFHPVPGPRANYYIDLSSADTSNIAAYIENGQVEIPLYYANIPSPLNDSRWWPSFDKEFNWNDGTSGSFEFMAGLYPSNVYGADENNPVGTRYMDYDPSTSGYAFTADFSMVEEAYDPTNGSNPVFIYPQQSDAANITISANLGSIVNQSQAYDSTSDTTDYNFYVRTKSQSYDKQDAGWLRLSEDMEYGVYVSNKTYLRTYYNQVMENMMAQSYTYYSWETFREATRLIADYLNNYMELADKYIDRTDNLTYDSTQDYQKQLDAGYMNDLNSLGGLKDVLENESDFNKFLTNHSDDTQGALCFLLTVAKEQLFDYQTFQKFKDAYSEYMSLNERYDEFTATSWNAYKKYAGTIEIGDTGITIDKLDTYDYNVNDSETDVDTDIYNPSNPDQPYTNNSWKIIYDAYLGGNAKDAFVKATEEIQKAVGLLRTKADYRNLNTSMGNAEPYQQNRNTMLGYKDTDLSDLTAAAGITGTQGKNMFTIDSSTVDRLAYTMNQDSGYYENDTGTYTVSSIATFDKVFSNVYDIKGTGNTNYANGVADPNATDTLTPITDKGELNENGEGYYSALVRDDQQRYVDVSDVPGDGEDQSTPSEVQDLVDYKARVVTDAIDQLQQVDSDSAYQTFDYLIDVVASIDFNAYTPTAQQTLWDELYQLLVNGGVYSVNQQFFAKEASADDDELAQAVYDINDTGAYTGRNSANVDEATTELMTLLNTLEKKTYDVTFTVHYKKLDGTDADPATVKVDAEPKTYGDSLTLNIPGFNGSQMYAYSWVVTTNPGQENELVQNLSNMGGTYTYTANNPANIDVYVTMGMPDPSYNPQAEGYTPVTVRRNLGGERNELAMSLTDEQLAKYTVEVNGDTLTFKDGGGQTITTVTAGLVPFHEFTGWKTISGKGVQFADDDTTRTFYLKDLLYGSAEITITPTYIITGHEYQVYVNNSEAPILIGGVAFNTLVTIGSEQTVDNLDGTFYAWLIKEGSSYKIASYAQDYSFHVGSGDVEIVQVNVSEDGKTYYLNDIYGLNGDKGSVVTLDFSTMYVDKDEIKEIDTDSLYYRLSNKLRDSWSTNSEFDETSRKIALYSSYTDASQAEGKGVAEVAECGALFVRVKGEVTDPSAFANRLVVDAAGVQKFVSGSQTNTDQQEGQYTITVHFADDTDYSDTDALMRSYVTYKYTFTNENGETSEVFRTAYSDVKAIDLAKATIQAGGDNA